MSRRINVFLCHSRMDDQFLEELLRHLAHLERHQGIELWHELLIGGGDDRVARLAHFFGNADIILALVSSDFLASDEIVRQLERVTQRGPDRVARFIPILVRQAHWRTSLLGNLQALPRNGTPVASWQNRDEAWFEIVQGIDRAIEEERVRGNLAVQNRLLREELIREREAGAQREEQFKAMQSRFDALQQEYDRLLARMQERISEANKALIVELRGLNEQNALLAGKVEFLTAQLAAMTGKLGVAESARGDDSRSIKELQQQRQQDRDEIRRLKEALKQKSDLLQTMENRRLVRARMISELAQPDASGSAVAWSFRVENIGEGIIRLIRVELNWAVVSTTDDSLQGLFGTGQTASRQIEPLLSTWELREFPAGTVVDIGEISDSFSIEFLLNSPAAQTLTQMHLARFKDRSAVGWSKAIRPVVRLLIEGQSVKHREVVEVAFS